MTTEHAVVGHAGPQGRQEQQERPEYDQILDSVFTSVSETYYSQLIQSVSIARGRAQAAQSTITLFAGGLMAALSVTTLADRSRPTQWLGIASVALWLVTALLYLRAVASPVPELWDRKVTTRQQLLNTVIAKVRGEAQTIDRRQRCANRAAAAAVVLSIATFAATVLVDPVRETAEGTVVVDSSYAPALRALCSKGTAAAGRIDGSILKKSLTTSFVEIVPAGDVCGPQHPTLYVPRGKVRAVRWHDA
ncbi:hypothetical protein [Streptomyces longispororuber]|uniref:hypothetical protein n=1 Tax=Streptomyces longispororuber TaxID=68230 RepID=UPI00210F1182|nr:hypothetical protein [Streptomyces longispororuber]MCQ4210302.1 hypothetical protein [Streptomyces longispororuber]